MDNLNFVSIVIPSRNEERFIGKCLDSIIANDYPKDMLEVLVVDGMSEDRTRDVVNKYSEKYSWIRLLENYKKTTPAAFNKGIEQSKGNILMIIGAHSTCEKDYIAKCIKYLRGLDADNVGGIWKILPQNNTLIAKSIIHALSSPFGAGNAYYRIGSKKARLVDTVWGGCYKREIFDKIGLFDEDFVRNQDDELNYRLTKSGGKIYLVPEIVSCYHARSSLSRLWAQYFQYGYWKVRVILKHRLPASWRHVMPIVLVSGLIVSAVFALFNLVGLYLLIFIAGFYSALMAFFSARISIRKGWKYFFVLPLAFSTIHFSYGLGFLKGIFDFIIFKKHLKKKIEDEALTR